MFEVGFSEIVVIFALALVVLGPDKLPKLAATIGRWVGRARVMARQFRDQLEAEADTIKKSGDSFREEFREIHGSLEDVSRAVDAPATTPAPAATPATPVATPAATPAAVPAPAAPLPAPPTANDNPVTDDTFSHAHQEPQGNEPGKRTPG